MRKQNTQQFARLINDDKRLYYIFDDNHHILVRLIDFQIHLYNASTNAWFNTGYMVTEQYNQTRSIMRAWMTYLKKVYGTIDSEIYINIT